jgi:hypothetical protein
MNGRTILAVDTLGDALVARIVRAPFPVGATALCPLTLRVAQFTGPDAIVDTRGRGKAVRDALRQHPSLSGILDELRRVMPHQVSPLLVQLGLSDAELVHWETLCDIDDTFVALDPRWPIARIVDPVNAPQRPPCELTTPVRLMAVISALGIRDQQREWQLLRDAVVTARADGLPVLLKVLVGDPALYGVIAGEKAAGLAQLELGAIEDTPARLTQAIRAWSPNVLHVFCHGHADTAGQALELATANDHVQHAAGDPHTVAGSVRVPAPSLARLGESLGNPWLLVLNCCSSGQAATGLQSMASQVVSTGFPAVVAMVEPVDAHDAYEFTRAFYPAALAALRQAQAALAGATSTTLEWTPVLSHARAAIAQRPDRDDASPEWALPVLYVRGLDAQVFIRPLAAGTAEPAADTGTHRHRVQAETFAAWLRTAGQQMPPDDRHAVMTIALADVPTELWPDIDGNFEHGR